MNGQVIRLATPPRRIVLTAVKPDFVICNVQPAGGYEKHAGHFSSPGQALDFALRLAEELGLEIEIWQPAARRPAS